MLSSPLANEARLAQWVASLSEARTHPKSESDISGLGSTMEHSSPNISSVPTSTQHLSYMPRILQVHKNPDPSSLHGPTSPSTSMHEGVQENELKNDETECSPNASQSPMQIVMWSPGRLNISCYNEQNAYLDRVVKVCFYSAMPLSRNLIC